MIICSFHFQNVVFTLLNVSVRCIGKPEESATVLQTNETNQASFDKTALGSTKPSPPLLRMFVQIVSIGVNCEAWPSSKVLKTVSDGRTGTGGRFLDLTRRFARRHGRQSTLVDPDVLRAIKVTI